MATSANSPVRRKKPLSVEPDCRSIYLTASAVDWPKSASPRTDQSRKPCDMPKTVGAGYQVDFLTRV